MSEKISHVVIKHVGIVRGTRLKKTDIWDSCPFWSATKHDQYSLQGTTGPTCRISRVHCVYGPIAIVVPDNCPLRKGMIHLKLQED